MCIIAVKRSGIAMPTEDILRKCFINNADGAGYMFSRRGQVHIRKGFMKFKEFLSDLRSCNLRKEDSVIFHFRIATAGAVEPALTHPFPVSQEPRELLSTRIDTDMAMAHNGIIASMSYSNAAYSDTQYFIMRVLGHQAVKETIFDEKSRFAESIIGQCFGSKFAFLNGSGQIRLFGDFIKDEGIMYSNHGYKYGTYCYGPQWGWKKGEDGVYRKEESATAFTDLEKLTDERIFCTFCKEFFDSQDVIYTSSHICPNCYQDLPGAE